VIRLRNSEARSISCLTGIWSPDGMLFHGPFYFLLSPCIGVFASTAAISIPRIVSPSSPYGPAFVWFCFWVCGFEDC
jgi:hypothetical protein